MSHCSVASLIVLLVQGIVFVYDITNGPSFQHLAKWVSDVDEVRPPTLSSFSSEWPHGDMFMFAADSVAGNCAFVSSFIYPSIYSVYFCP